MIRSTLFNLAFYIVTGISCIIFLPFLLLPRSAFMWVVGVFVHSVALMEKYILGLTYEVRGDEYLPKDGPFIVAAKHQSPYETFKLRLLFDDPAIILKKELTRIPLWGWYLAKSDVIAIDRGSPEAALRSMEEGALRMKEQGRPIVIFPQGTRVWPHETTKDKPYKAGLSRIQKATGLPIVPMALNSGAYWPRRGWVKRSGRVVFEFMEPIPPGAMEKKELMADLEHRIEEKSDQLMEEAMTGTFDDGPDYTPVILVLLLVLLAGLYTAYWHYAADLAQKTYVKFLYDLTEEERLFTVPEISGFPGPITLTVDKEYLQSPEGTLRAENLSLKGWLFPGIPAHIHADSVSISSFRWQEPLRFESLDADISVLGSIVTIHDSLLRRGEFEGGATGTIDLSKEPYPEFDVIITLRNQLTLLSYLTQQGIMEERNALFISAGLSVFQQDGIVTVPLTQSGNTLFAGPLAVARLPAPKPTSSTSENPGNLPDL